MTALEMPTNAPPPRYFHRVLGMAQGMQRGRLDFVLPDGSRHVAQGQAPGPEAEITLHHRDVFARLIREGDLGFCEAYVDGWWSTPDLMAFLDLVHANEEMFDGYPGGAVVRAFERLRFWLQRNTKRQARRNISAHYDLGNDFYGLWLDETMTYSSALFEHGHESLADAQIAKYAALVDSLDVQPGDHVLEIGCGWGGFAEYAAKERGLRVTGLTISAEQHQFAQERMAREGLSDRVDLKLQDYRDETGRYDAIASIEMFEAVGEQYWPAYFDTVHGRLKPGRRASLQVITVQHKRWEVYRRGVDFIQKYIFPGGMLPSPVVLREAVERSGLRVEGSREFGQSYARTLDLWFDAFNARWDHAALQGFDDRFRRMWNFYLASCAATFRSGNCDVTQITIARPQ